MASGYGYHGLIRVRYDSIVRRRRLGRSIPVSGNLLLLLLLLLGLDCYFLDGRYYLGSGRFS